MNKLKYFIINESASIKQALVFLNKNMHGILFVSDTSEKILGAVTDGDIRRRLLDGYSIHDRIDLCMNKDFIKAHPTDSRESMIKKFDNNFKVIPLIDSNGALKKIYTQNNFPVASEQANYARAKAPVRISFGGGGSDLTHFFSHQRGVVLNATISLYSHAVLKKRSDSKIIIYSADLGLTIKASNLQAALKKKSKLSLVQAVLELANPDFGFELQLYSDFPTSSGLGGSSAITSAILGAFNEFRDDSWSEYEIAEIAFQAERISLKISGGWQDQYACTFGGFNFMEFTADDNLIFPLRLNKKIALELEECLILCDTGIAHDSGDIHDDQKISMSDSKVSELVKSNVTNTEHIKKAMLKGDLEKFASLLDKAWNFKRKFSAKISNARLDALYDDAKKNGALGGKLLGAGGGGFFLFYARPFDRPALIKHLLSKNLSIVNFTFDDSGLQSWKYRE